MSVSQNEAFIEGVNEFLKAAGFDADVAEQLRGLTVDETDGAIEQTKQAQGASLSKAASVILESEDASALEKFLVKQAQKEGPDAKIIQEDGKFKVVKVKDNGENGEVLGSYDDRPDAQARLDKYYSKAAPAMEQDSSGKDKEAQMTDPGSQGYEGRKELAKKYMDGGEFDHSRCYSEQKDNVDDAHAFCRSLASLVGRGHEATRGENEGEQS